ncbi:MAG TPA: M23 family metallopeptidase, partial [Aggregatilineales bacterium]|nr:M23 family metallopeptidase [Aggregatilineales bacterium]
FILTLTLILVTSLISTAQQPFEKPMILPVQISPGPSSWLVGQFYGNTTGAYNYGTRWYSAGQRLHFGIDMFMPCGTPVVAVADGEVHAVDAMAFGSAPHNLILVHRDLNLSTLYGHLLEAPTVVPGQPVRQGDVVALSGDPDGVCDSRPHLHLEVRSLDFRSTFNPVDFIDAPWHTLANIGPFSNPQFQQDMDNPRRWMSVDDQPDVIFGGAPLNDYASVWPYPLDIRPPVNAPLRRELDLLPGNVTFALKQPGFGGCCPQPWWNPTDSSRFYVIDGVPGERASVFEWTVDNSIAPTPIEEAPPMLLSPDGTHHVTRVNGQITIRNLVDSIEWTVETQGALPAVSTDNSRLLWEIWRGEFLPGEPYQTVETWVSDIDGSNARMILQQSGGWSVWLDENRVLIVTPVLDRTDTTLTIFDTRDDSSYILGTFDWLRDITIAPGGGRLMFYVIWQPDPAQNGIYSIETRQGASAEQLPFFGAWRWRDAESVYYIPFDVNSENSNH